MIPINAKSHPIPRTSVDLRRSINRLITHKEAFPNDGYVLDGTVDQLIEALRQARYLIPKSERDHDLTEASSQ